MIAKFPSRRPSRSTRFVLNVLFLLLFCASLTLSGCAVLPALQDSAAADFRLRGKIGVRGGTENDGFAASFDWIQAGEHYVIELWGPFGQGRTRLQGDGTTLTITDPYGTTLVGESPETLMQQHLGWSAPVVVLGHWVRGRPAPGYAATLHEHDAQGHLERFAQLGWTVELSRWRDRASGVLPGKVVAIRNGRRVTVICREWSS